MRESSPRLDMGGQRKKTAKKKKPGGGGGAGSQRVGPDLSALRMCAEEGDSTATAVVCADGPRQESEELAWVRVIVRRGRVKTQEWVRCDILARDEATDSITVRSQGKIMELTDGQVYVGPNAPTDSTKTMEDASRLRREIFAARGDQLSSAVWRGPVPFESAVSVNWLAKDIENTREELLLHTARKYNAVVISAVSHYESYLSLLEHDMLHVASDLERRATVVKSLQRACRNQKRSAELERKHEAMVKQSKGYSSNVAVIKSEALGFRRSPIGKKASVHVNHTWKRYGSSGEFMRRADVAEDEQQAMSFEALLSEMKHEDEQMDDPHDDKLLDDGWGVPSISGALADAHFISFGPGQWWWLSTKERIALVPKRKKKLQQPPEAAPPRSSSSGSSTGAPSAKSQMLLASALQSPVFPREVPEPEPERSDGKSKRAPAGGVVPEIEIEAAPEDEDASKQRRNLSDLIPVRSQGKTIELTREQVHGQLLREGAPIAAADFIYPTDEEVAEAILTGQTVLDTGGVTPDAMFEEAVQHGKKHPVI